VASAYTTRRAVTRRSWGQCPLPSPPTVAEGGAASPVLELTEREQSPNLCAGGRSIRAVAAALGRPPSTISRELPRNANPDQPETATGHMQLSLPH
jgi:hypothetical protein